MKNHKVLAIVTAIFSAGCIFTASAAEYVVKNTWGESKPTPETEDGGLFVLGTRGTTQLPIEFKISSTDNGITFNGTMKYQGEGDINFYAQLSSHNTYDVQTQYSVGKWGMLEG